ncbi:hypothetical protein CBR_g20038 [Chara braunii]|uniref:F-box domain-containing protein n=1 Tax=Chara braunii TaxID=69332 RepID=A0A388KZG5_CHABU|nr:hypothetical protein CBR_g20038 [Chara braunii]|eukprot:GBG75408.1 hypothetical protein CBR_g20038 [Chara braunii]
MATGRDSAGGRERGLNSAERWEWREVGREGRGNGKANGKRGLRQDFMPMERSSEARWVERGREGVRFGGEVVGMKRGREGWIQGGTARGIGVVLRKYVGRWEWREVGMEERGKRKEKGKRNLRRQVSLPMERSEARRVESERDGPDKLGREMGIERGREGGRHRGIARGRERGLSRVVERWEWTEGGREGRVRKGNFKAKGKRDARQRSMSVTTRSKLRCVDRRDNLVDKPDRPADVADKADDDDIPPPPPVVLPDWSSLPTDVLAVILSFLPIRERFRAWIVCERWRCASVDPVCWRQADLMDMKDDEISAEATRAVIVRSRGQLRSLSLRFCDDGLLQYIGAHCPLLEKIKIDEMEGDDFSRMIKNRFRPSIRSIKIFVDGCRQLRSLHLFAELEVGREELSEIVRVLLSGSPHLVSLYLDVSTICRRRLIERARVRSWLFEMDIDDLRFMIEHLPNLETLGLRHACVTDAVLDLIGKDMQSLRSLFLQYCSYLTWEGLRALQSARKDLHVTMKNCIREDPFAEYSW